MNLNKQISPAARAAAANLCGFAGDEPESFVNFLQWTAAMQATPSAADVAEAYVEHQLADLPCVEIPADVGVRGKKFAFTPGERERVLRRLVLGGTRARELAAALDADGEAIKCGGADARILRAAMR